MGLWSLLLALGWLQPNHYQPWPTFHTDAWVASVLAVAAVVVLLRTTGPIVWRPMPVFFALVACIPAAQFFWGKIPYVGQMTVNTLYCAGFVLAMVVGSRWESATPGSAADALFLGIGLAAIVSVGLQLREWLHIQWPLGLAEAWVSEFSPGRPAANLGQPNQLATLLLWGLLAGAWGMVRGKIGLVVGVVLALFLLLGLALTQSRMGMLALLVLIAAGWYWRRSLPQNTVRNLVILFVYYLACTYLLGYASDFLDLPYEARSMSLGGDSSSQRLQAYFLFIDAIKQQPWFGYGWGRLAVAQLAVAQDHPNMTAFFMHSHNLFLDFVLWCGIPLGLLISVVLIVWILRRVLGVKDREDVILVLVLLVVGLHAMLELPLHHAYFLLPTGLVMGMLEERQRVVAWFQASRPTVVALLLVAGVVSGTVIRDYLLVDESFRAFRFEVRRIGSLPPGPTPDVIVLDDLADFMRNARSTFDPSRISEAEYQHLGKVMYSFPNVGNLMRFAQATAYLRGPEEARSWLLKIEKVLPEDAIKGAKVAWFNDGKKYPKLAEISWPEVTLKTEKQ